MRHGFLAAILALVVTAGTASAAAAPPGAAACSGCHRPAGGGAVPAIHGRPAAEIVAAMQAYRAGERSPSVMNRIATGFDDGEVRAIAAWLEEQR